MTGYEVWHTYSQVTNEKFGGGEGGLWKMELQN
jgi:hypothetical protein